MLEIFHPHKRLGSIEQIKCLSPKELRIKKQRIKRSFTGQPIYPGLDGYPYSLFELTDGPVAADLINDMADLIINSENFKGADLLVSEADRGGGLLLQAIGSKTGIRITPANWHSVSPDAKGIVRVRADAGFSGKGEILIHGIQPGQKVIFVDDLLSTGGTAEAIIKAIRKAGATIEHAFFIGEKFFVDEKGNVKQVGRERLKQQFPDITVTTLAKFVSEEEFTKNAESYILAKLIGSRRFDFQGCGHFVSAEELEDIHEIANFENNIYDRIMEKYRKYLLNRIFHNKDKIKTKEEMEKIINEIELNYSRGQIFGTGNIFTKKAEEIIEKYVSD